MKAADDSVSLRMTMISMRGDEYLGVPLGVGRRRDAFARFDQNHVNGDSYPTSTGPLLMGTGQHQRDSVLVAEGSVSEPHVFHLFGSQESFNIWAGSTRLTAVFEHVAEIVNRTRQRKDITLEKEPSRLRSVQVIANSPIDREWADQVVPPSGLESSATLFEDAYFKGRSMATGPCAIDDLSDIDFFKDVASIKVRGVCLLTELKFFGGTHLYIIGAPVVEVPNLARWSFSRQAASAIVL